MPTIYRESSCCRAVVRRFGSRRRQCSVCGKTWRVHKQRRGRKKRLMSQTLFEQIVRYGRNIVGQQQRYGHCTVSALEKRLQREMTKRNKEPRCWPQWQGSYTLLCDGLWFRFNRQDFVLFEFILKPRRRTYGYLLDPLLLPGKESFANWRAAVENSVPLSVRKRIFAFVSDDFSATSAIADTFQWKEQRCHFHLLSELHKRRGRRKKNLSGRVVREQIYQTIQAMLIEKSPFCLQNHVNKLKHLCGHRECPHKLRMIATQFLRQLPIYRAYLSYPQETIPRTTSALESFNNIMRGRLRPLRTPQAVQRWATAIVKSYHTIQCNGYRKRSKIQPN